MRRHAGLAFLLLILGATPAAAQWRTTAGVAAWYDGDVPGSSFRLAPTFTLDGQRGVLTGGVMGSSTEIEARYRAARLAGAWVFDPIKRLPIELKASVSHRGGAGWTDRGLGRVEGRLHFAAPTAGAWMGLATEQAYGLTGQMGERPLIGFGAWTRNRGSCDFTKCRIPTSKIAPCGIAQKSEPSNSLGAPTSKCGAAFPAWARRSRAGWISRSAALTIGFPARFHFS